MKSGTEDPLAARLQEILKEAAKYQATPPQPGLWGALQAEHSRLDLDALKRLQQLGQGIPELIIADPRVYGSGVRMVSNPHGASGFYPHFVGSPLLRKLLQTSSADAAIQWLQKVMQLEGADGCLVTALWNVPVEGNVQLTDDLRLVPFESLPDSPQKRAMLRGEIHLDAIFKPPTSAIVAPYRIAPLIINPFQWKPSLVDTETIYEKVNEALLVISLVGPRIPLQAGHWFSFDDQDVELALAGSGHGWQEVEIIPRHSQKPPPPLDHLEVARLIAKYRKLNGSTKVKVGIAIERLRNSIARHRVGDQAVELSIALESLLGDSANSEMTHKVSVRAVRLLGGNESTRLENLKTLKKTYSIRSKLVHQGTHDAGAEEFLTKATAHCAKVIKIVIERGEIPDWPNFDIGEHC